MVDHLYLALKRLNLPGRERGRAREEEIRRLNSLVCEYIERRVGLAHMEKLFSRLVTHQVLPVRALNLCPPAPPPKKTRPLGSRSAGISFCARGMTLQNARVCGSTCLYEEETRFGAFTSNFNGGEVNTLP